MRHIWNLLNVKFNSPPLSRLHFWHALRQLVVIHASLVPHSPEFCQTSQALSLPKALMHVLAAAAVKGGMTDLFFIPYNDMDS